MTAKPFVVITSIHAPSHSVRQFADRVGDRLIVVGDRKTPSDWKLPPVDYLGPDAHTAHGGALEGQLPWNHYGRKMLGYLHAVRRGAEIIYDTDDDNAPKADWHIPEFEGAYARTADGLGYINIYRSFIDAHVWPRGFPLRSIRDPRTVVRHEQAPLSQVRVGVWQGLADGEPDVDAIYRLVDGTPRIFEDRPPLVLGIDTLSPFNSQVTAFQRALFPLLYLPTTVTPRFTDILRGFVAQPIMWAAGYLLGFTKATVIQERNPHDYLEDFESELPCYRYADVIPGIVSASIRPDASLGDNLVAAYQALGHAGIVGREEVSRVAAWLQDLDSATA